MSCKVMGIVNVTPDSFSDGGKYFTPEEAVRRARNLMDEGADIIDLGAESTRPGATPVTWEEEWRRLEPVLSCLVPIVTAAGKDISIDTYHPETASRAIAAGATIMNCVYPEPAEKMVDLCAENGVKLVFPASLLKSVSRERLLKVAGWADPMLGFGTDRDQDLELLRSVPELAKEFPILVGASRKRIVKKLTGEKVTGKNLGGNLGIAIWCAMNGATAIRVHDVRETVQALKVVDVISGRD